MTEYELTLYITGRTPRSEQAVINLRNICNNELKDRVKLVIIDVLDHPELAEEKRILATPTLIKQKPEPVKIIIGDLTDKEKVFRNLDINIQG